MCLLVSSYLLADVALRNRPLGIAAILVAGLVCDVSGQAQTATIRVEIVISTGEPVSGAEVVVTGITHLADDNGVVVLSVPEGRVQVTVLQEGFIPITVPVDVVARQERLVRVELVEELVVEEEVTVVASTRTERRIEDQAMRVEVLNREEVEEKMLMTPGDIGMMLNETGGLRVQTTSPSTGCLERAYSGYAWPLYPFPVRWPANLWQPAKRSGATSDSADGPQSDRGDQGRRVRTLRCRSTWRSRQPPLSSSGRRTGARVPHQPVDTGRDRWRPCGYPRRCPTDGVSPFSGAATSSTRRTSMATDGLTWPITSAVWCDRDCSGTTGRGSRSS